MGRTACIINLELHCPRDDVVCEEEDSARGSDIEDNIILLLKPFDDTSSYRNAQLDLKITGLLDVSLLIVANED